MTRELFNVKQVQETLGLSERTVFRLIKDGELKGFKAGREWRFEPSDIDDFIKHQRKITYYNSTVENSIAFTRDNGERVNLVVGKRPDQEVSLTVFSPEDVNFEHPRETITLTYQEARLLRDLLNRPEVQMLLNQEETK